MKIKFGDSSLNLKAGGSLANIDRGPRGYSAYEIAVQEGFVGTEEEWLASLVGPEGKQGKDGERGIQGPRGQQGDKGDKGDTGETGPSNVLSIGSVTKGDEANATITGESPNQTLNLVLPKGDKGDKGDTGNKGDTGARGPQGIQGVQGPKGDKGDTGNDGYTPVKGVDYFTSEDIASLNIPDSLSDLSDDSTHRTVTDAEKSTWNNKYDKPSGGIPATDLSGQVQTSLGKADTALQEHQDLTDYVKNTDYASSSKGGVIRVNSASYNVSTSASGQLISVARTYQQYNNMQNNSFISKGTLENVISGKELIDQTTLDESQEVQDANIEENASNIDWLQTLVNQMPHVAGQGTDLSLESVLNYRLMKFLPQGVSKQFSTNGYQLIDFGILQPYPLNTTIITFEDNILTVSNSTAYAYARATTDITEIIKNNPNKSVRFGYDSLDKSESATVQLVIRYNDGTATKYISLLTNYFLIPDNTDVLSSVVIGVYSNNSGTSKVGNIVITKPILYFGDTKPDYEPYTDGSAPNPDYTYSVSNVTGENSLILQNENLYNKNTSVSEELNGSDGTSSSSNTYSTSDYIRVVPGQDYYLTGKNDGYSNCFYDNNKNFIQTIQKTTGVITVPDNQNIAFIRFNSNKTYKNTIMFIKGSTAPTTYVEHEEQNYLITLKSDNLIGLDTAQYPVDLKVGDKITLTSQLENTTLQLNLYTNFGDSERNDYWSIQPGQSRTITVAKDSKAIAWNRLFSGLAWVNKGETSLSYKPYIANPIELNSSPDETIRDQIVGKPNEWYKREYISKVVLNGSESYGVNSTGDGYISFTISNYINIIDKSIPNNLYSNMLKSATSGNMANTCRIASSGKVVISFKPDFCDYNSPALKEKLQTMYNNNNPLILYIPLAQYTDIPITDTTLISQLNDIYNNAHSHNGVTNITTTYEDGNEQMYLDIEALKNVWEVTE